MRFDRLAVLPSLSGRPVRSGCSAQRDVALENPLLVGVGNARAPVAHRQAGPVRVPFELHFQLAAFGRHFDRVVDHVFDHGLDQVGAGPHHDARRDVVLQRQATARETVAIGRQHALEKLGQVDPFARRIEQFGARPVQLAGAGDQPVEAIDRFLDHLERAPAARVVRRNQPVQGLERLAHDRDRRLEGVGVVLGGEAQALRRIPQSPGHAIELLGHEGELRHLVLSHEAGAFGAPGADPAGHVPEPPEPAPNGEEQADGEDRHGEIDPGGDTHLDGLPVWLVDGGAQHRGRRVRGDHGPASRLGRHRRDRGQELLLAARHAVPERHGDRALARLHQPVEHATLAQPVPFLVQGRGRNRRLGGDEEEPVQTAVVGRMV